MKRSRTATVLVGTILLGFSAKGAQAADIGHMNVPFPFEVNRETLPAGRYDVRTDDENPAVLMILGTRTKAHAIVHTTPEYGRAPSGNKPALTFVRDGRQYRLLTAWEHRDLGYDVVGR